MEKIITDFEENNVQYVVDENLIVYARIDNNFYTVYNFIDYIKSLRSFDPDKIKMVANVQSTLCNCQTELNIYKKLFDGRLIRSMKEAIDELIDRLVLK